MRTLNSSRPTNAHVGTIDKLPVKAAAGGEDSSYIINQLGISQLPNKELNSQSNTPLIPSAKHEKSVSELNSRNKNVCSISSKELSNSKNKQDLKNDQNYEKEKSNDNEEKVNKKDNRYLDINRDKNNKRMVQIGLNVSENVMDNKHNSDDTDEEDTKESKMSKNKPINNRASVRKLKYSKSRKASTDTDDDDADDEDTDNDDINENEEKGIVTVPLPERNTKDTSIEDKSLKNSVSEELRAKMLNLKVNDDSPGLDAVKKTLSELQISSTEESSDDSDSSSVNCGYLPRAPERNNVTRTAMLHETIAPYYLNTHQQRYLRTPDRVAGSLSHPQPPKDCSDFNDITLTPFEREDLKKMAPNALHIMKNEFQVNCGTSDGESSIYKMPSVNNLKPVTNNSSQFVCNIPPDVSSGLCNNEFISSKYTSEMLSYDQSYQNHSLENYYRNSQSASCSPNSITSIDSVVTDDGSTNLKKMSDDITSDYGSPSGSNELSPAPSVSPEYSNSTDSTMYQTLINPGSYVGTFEYDSYGTKMNVPGEGASIPLSSNRTLAFGTMANVMTPLQGQPQQISVKTAFQNDVALRNAKQKWSSIPSAKNNHGLENVKQKCPVNISPRVENGVKMVIFNSAGQKISGESGMLSGENSNHKMFSEFSKDPKSKIGNKTNLRRIVQVGGPQVYETEMQKSGIKRLTDLCNCDKKKSSLMIQWVTALVETNRLDEQNKSLILIKLLNQLACTFGDKPETVETQNLKRVWVEKLMACIQVVYKLLCKPAIFSTPDAEGNTPLKIAAFDNYKEPLIARVIADSIVSDNKNPNEVYENGDSILHLLCQKGGSHVKVLAELLNVKKDNRPAFNVNCTNFFGQTPLHMAVNSQYRSLAVVKVLIAHHAKVDAQDYFNNTPLHIALSDDYDLGVLKMLLQSQSSQQAFNLQDSEKNFPLMIAGKNNHDKDKQLEAIQCLVSSGANIKPLKQILNNLEPSTREEIKNLLQGMKKY